MGLLQTIADETKLFLKRRFGVSFVLAKRSIGVFSWIAISSIGPIGLVMVEHSSSTTYYFH
jgi:NADH:ubiquinone oxidoreductase subunit H